MITLRELTAEDLPRIVRWRGSRELYRWLAGDFRPTTPDQERAWFDAYRKRRGLDERFAICIAMTGEHVGNLYLLNIDRSAGSAEFHIFIAEAAHRGKGYGEAATRAGLAHAFGELRLNRVELQVLEDNAPAISLYEKCGFRREGTLRHRKDGAEVSVVHMVAHPR